MFKNKYDNCLCTKIWQNDMGLYLSLVTYVLEVLMQFEININQLIFYRGRLRQEVLSPIGPPCPAFPSKPPSCQSQTPPRTELGLPPGVILPFIPIRGVAIPDGANPIPPCIEPGGSEAGMRALTGCSITFTGELRRSKRV